MAKPAPSALPGNASTAPSIVAGIGCRRGVEANEIVALVEAALRAAGWPAATLVAMASLDRKANEPGLLAAATYFAIPLTTFTASELSHPGAGSAKVLALVGTSSVAEAAARRAGPLIWPKMKSVRVTCALAITGPNFDPAAFGQIAVGSAPASVASTAASRVLTSSAGP